MYHLCIQGRPNRQTLILQNRTMEITTWQSIRYHRFCWSLRIEITVSNILFEAIYFHFVDQKCKFDCS